MMPEPEALGPWTQQWPWVLHLLAPEVAQISKPTLLLLLTARANADDTEC